MNKQHSGIVNGEHVSYTRNQLYKMTDISWHLLDQILRTSETGQEVLDRCKIWKGIINTEAKNSWLYRTTGYYNNEKVDNLLIEWGM